MKYEAIVVGGGIAGLTAASYLAKAGKQVLLCEQADHLGGLVGSITTEGHVLDFGIRAFENSGIVKPMLKQLGIDPQFVKSPVTIGIGHDFISLSRRESLDDYVALLTRAFPDDVASIKAIRLEIEKVMDYMDVLYGIENPLFLNYMENPKYIFETLLPWLMKYKKNVRKAMKLDMPINDYLGKFTRNQSLIDMITQHFFQGTPAFFALSYFSLYLDYNYPVGGTGTIVTKMQELIERNGGIIRLNDGIVSLDPSAKTVTTASHQVYQYETLIWAADMNGLYTTLGKASSLPKSIEKKILQHQKRLMGKQGSDSVLTVYLSAEVEPQAFRKLSGAHSFYTPSSIGLSGKLTSGYRGPQTREAMLEDVLAVYLRHTTYEISIPALRDAALAPEGHTGLIVSTLLDYDFVKQIEQAGLYQEFKRFAEQQILSVLSDSAFGLIKGKTAILGSSSPLTIERFTKGHQGAITGWAFTNNPQPVENGFARITKSIDTPFSQLWQAGQWVFAPAGLPVSVLTAKLAADAAIKHLSRKH